jgi:hypothetical protein
MGDRAGHRLTAILPRGCAQSHRARRIAYR